MLEIPGWPCLLCCLNYQKAICIDITIIITSIIEIILNVLDIVIIPWKSTSKIMIILLGLSILIFVISALFAAILICFRNNKKIYSDETIYDIVFCFPIVAIIIIVISIILSIVVCIVVLKDISGSSKDGLYEQTSKEEVSDGKKIFTIVSLVVICVIGIFLIALWASDYLRIKYKTNSSYSNHVRIAIALEKLKRNNKFEKSSIVGHDKTGKPIFGMKIGDEIKTIPVQNEANNNNVNNNNANNINNINNNYINNNYVNNNINNNVNNINNTNNNVNIIGNSTIEDKSITHKAVYDKYRSRSKLNTQDNNFEITCEDIVNNTTQNLNNIDMEGGVVVDVVNHNNSINPGLYG